MALALLSQFASAATVPPITLAWNQNPESDIAGYEIKYGTTSGSYGTTVNAGLSTTTSISGLTEGATYYFVVIAFNTAGLRSQPSSQISYTATIPTPNQAPQSTISGPSANVAITVGQAVSFTGSGSDPDGNTPLTYRWSFGSGSGIADSTAQNPGSRTFNSPGTFVVTFTVTDSLGLADPTPATRTITVSPPVVVNQAPQSTISTPSGDTSITVGGTLSFSGSGSDPDGNTPLTYRWSFGSGSGFADSTSQNPGTRRFNTAGTFVVTFTVIDSLGLADPTPATRTITVSAPNQSPDSTISSPSADMSITEGGVVFFAGSATDPDGNVPLTYRWNFGAGSGIADSTEQSPSTRIFRTAGTYVVTFTASDSLGLADQTPATRTITVKPPNQAPNSTISAPSITVTIAAGGNVSFAGGGTDPDGNTPLGYRWNFGAGSGVADSTLQNPGPVQFNNPGTFQVTFTATDSLGLADPTPATQTLIVTAPVANRAPDSVISSPASDVSITAGASVTFQGVGSDPDGNTPLTYLWNFGNNSGITPSTAQNPGAKQFNTPGTYVVSFTAIDSKGFADPTPATRTITVTAAPANQAPDGVISAPALNGSITVGQTVNFTGSGSDPDGNTPLTYLWNFGSGSGIANSTLQNPGSLQFNTPGTYVVTLTVSDSKGLADATPPTRTITVLSQPPSVPGLEGWITQPASDVTITAGGSVTFAGYGTDAYSLAGLTYLWKFGAGSGIPDSSYRNPGTRVFNTPGVYLVTFTVTNSRKQSDPSPAMVTVTVLGQTPSNQAPDSIISAPAANLSITAGGSVNFTGSGSDPDGNTPLTYLWNFGSGSGIANSTAQNPGLLQFNTPGTFVVSLTTTDAKGLADPTPATRTITVTAPTPPTPNQAPDSIVSAPAANLSITAGGSVNFTGSGSDPDGNTPLTYLWNFGSGSGVANSTAQNPGLLQFNTPGTYVVSLTATDAKGLADPTPATRTITVTAPTPPAPNQAPDSIVSAPAANLSITAGGSVNFTGSGSDPDGNTPLTYLWNFGSGSGIANSTAQNPGLLQFNTPGTYVVSFTATDAKGLADPTPATRTVTVLSPPSVPGLEGWITQPAANLTIAAGGSVYFSGYGIDRYSLSRLSYRWNFGVNSGIANSTAQNPGNRQFNTPGIYEVTFTVINSKGVPDPSPARVTIQVTAPAPLPLPALAKEVINDENYPTFTVTKPGVDDGRVRTVEVSSDLKTWHSGPAYVTVITDDATTLKVRANKPINQAPSCYFRLKTAQAPAK